MSRNTLLAALGVDEETYSSIVVPAILEKLTESLRLTITRGQNYLEWYLVDMLEVLLKEVELREECKEPPRATRVLTETEGPEDQPLRVLS